MNDQEAIEVVSGALVAFRFKRYLEESYGNTLLDFKNLRFQVVDGHWYAHVDFINGDWELVEFKFTDWIDWNAKHGYSY